MVRTGITGIMGYRLNLMTQNSPTVVTSTKDVHLVQFTEDLSWSGK